MRPRASERENNKETEVAACRCCRKDEKPESRVKKKSEFGIRGCTLHARRVVRERSSEFAK